MFEASQTQFWLRYVLVSGYILPKYDTIQNTLYYMLYYSNQTEAKAYIHPTHQLVMCRVLYFRWLALNSCWKFDVAPEILLDENDISQDYRHIVTYDIEEGG